MSLIRLGPGDLLAALGELGCARAASVYAALGFPVVPMYAARPGGGCSCPTRCVRTRASIPGWRLEAAGRDGSGVVGEWWRRWPQANLGLATGRRFDVLDLDGDQGVEALCAVLSIAPTEHPGPVARTGGGGWHLLYPPTGLGNRVGLLPGVDWRGRDGLIVAPPSRHASGAATLGSAADGDPARGPGRAAAAVGPTADRADHPPPSPTPTGRGVAMGGRPWPGNGPLWPPPSLAAQRHLEPGRVQPRPTGCRRAPGRRGGPGGAAGRRPGGRQPQGQSPSHHRVGAARWSRQAAARAGGGGAA